MSRGEIKLWKKVAKFESSEVFAYAKVKFAVASEVATQ